MQKSSLDICSRLYTLACFIGFLVHSVNFSISFFEYQTSTSMIIEIRQTIKTPDVAFCSRWTDIIDRSNASAYSLNSKRSNDPDIIDEDMSVLTLNQIFQLTPTINETIDYCHYRRNDTNEAILKNGLDCLEFFTVQKFYMQEFMLCLLFQDDYLLVLQGCS